MQEGASGYTDVSTGALCLKSAENSLLLGHTEQSQPNVQPNRPRPLATQEAAACGSQGLRSEFGSALAIPPLKIKSRKNKVEDMAQW